MKYRVFSDDVVNMNKTQLQKDILHWFHQHKRELPWRDDPAPYRVWISEIMLQQTKVSTVIPYFNRFVETIPDIKTLASIDTDILLKLWEGLGYYNRARNLKVAANQILENYSGILPDTKKELESLKGIGDYTSGAILSIAYNKKYAAVDGNVLRVFARLLEIKTNIKDKETKKEIKDFVESTLPEEEIGNYNQALMEIGALICLPNGAPKCEICPIREYCKAYEHNTTSEIPITVRRKKVPVEKKTIIILEHQGTYALKKRDDSGLLAGMYQFPMVDKHITKSEIKAMYEGIESITKLPNTSHKYSHKEWNMKAYHIVLRNKTRHSYVSKEDIDTFYSIPKAFRNYIKYVI